MGISLTVKIERNYLNNNSFTKLFTNAASM